MYKCLDVNYNLKKVVKTMIKLTNEVGAVVTKDVEEVMNYLDKLYGFKVVHKIDNCLIYHDVMYVLENPYGVRLEVIKDNDASDYVNAMHLTVEDFDEVMKVYKENGFEVEKEEVNEQAKCALVKKDKDVLFVVEHIK